METFKPGEIYCIQAGEFELMARFARKHNRECLQSLKPSDEDGQPYCRYRVIVTDGQVGQNYHVKCRECDTQECCVDGYNS